MEPGQPTSLQLPSCLYGLYTTVRQKTRKEGQRCGEQYRVDGTLPLPAQMKEVRPGEVVLTQGVSDFQHERPVWRLYMVSNAMGSFWEALADHNSITLRDAYEDVFLETAWGALYFAIEQMGPVSAKRTAQRLRAVLRFWDLLQSARYLFKKLGESLTLEELMEASCGWALRAWCPEDESSPVRERLETAAERMARATREDSIEAILREMPRALTSARRLQHRDVVGDSSFLREHLATLDAEGFERISAACTADLIAQLNLWDRQLGKH